MNVLETLSHKLALQCAAMQRGSGGRPELTPSDLAGMLAGLERGPVALAYAKLAGDESAARQVYAILHVLASDWSRREAWEVPKGSERVGLLARLVRDDLILTRESLSERSASRWLGVSRRQWREVWQARHYRLLQVGLEWECDVRRKLGRELYGGSDQ